MAQRALLIGGTGQIGIASAQALTEAGWEVTSAHRGGRRPPPELAARVLTLDREDTPALQRAAEGYDLVLDTVAYTPEHARQLTSLDVGSLVVISTVGVYLGRNGSYLDVATDADSFPDYPVGVDEDWPTVDNDQTTYSPLKAAMERVLLGSDLPVSILRPGAIHGPHSQGLRELYYIKRALDGRRRCVLAEDGNGRFHPAATANIAALVLACAQDPARRVLNAVDDQAPTDAEIAATLYELVGQPVEIVTFPGPPRGSLGDSPWAVAKPFVVSMARAHSELAYRAPVTYREGAQLDVEWVQRALHEGKRLGRSWQQIFAGESRFGVESWFDYAAEDDYVS